MKKLSEIKVCVGVTSCATGIAHTYMAADAIKKACKKYGTFDIDEDDIAFLAEEVNATPEWVKGVVEDLK